MKHVCMQCDTGIALKHTTQAVQVRVKGCMMTVAAISGWHCPVCGEIEYADHDSAERVWAALEAVSVQSLAAEAAQLAAIRRRLKLTQAQAAQLTGGGKNAFSRYERGQAKPMAAVVNLFKLLDKHPELLSEVR